MSEKITPRLRRALRKTSPYVPAPDIFLSIDVDVEDVHIHLAEMTVAAETGHIETVSDHWSEARASARRARSTGAASIEPSDMSFVVRSAFTNAAPRFVTEIQSSVKNHKVAQMEGFACALSFVCKIADIEEPSTSADQRKGFKNASSEWRQHARREARKGDTYWMKDFLMCSTQYATEYTIRGGKKVFNTSSIARIGYKNEISKISKTLLRSDMQDDFWKNKLEEQLVHAKEQIRLLPNPGSPLQYAWDEVSLRLPRFAPQGPRFKRKKDRNSTLNSILARGKTGVEDFLSSLFFNFTSWNDE